MSLRLNRTLNNVEHQLGLKQLQQFQHFKLHDNYQSTVYSVNGNKVYIPSETAKKFHESDAFVKIVMGPYGSGKSTLCCQHIVRMACLMPKWHHGRRKSKWLIVRNTSGELHSTTLPTWLLWFSELGDIKKRQKPLLTYEHTFNDGLGIVELDLVFIALDREEDIRKIKSFEATGAYINELSEVPQGALSHIKGRVNHRYPSLSSCASPYWAGIIADTNPPDIDHWIYKTFELQKLEDHILYRQPPGLLKSDTGWIRNPDADNAINLAPDYYTKLAGGQTNDFIKVFCLGEYGTVSFGKLVYPEFNPDLHAVDHIEAIQGDPIHLGWDGGLTPACIVVQLSPRGQFRVLKEYIGEDIGIRTFAESVVLPGLARDFPYCKIGKSVFDPSGIARDDIMEEMSCIGELNSIGIKTEPARSNHLEPRIGAVRYFLNRMPDGKPAFLIAKLDCPVTFRGFVRDYVFKRISVAGEERYKEIPDKNHASHPHDGVQYIAMEFAANRIAEEKAPEASKVDMRNPVFQWVN